ncbi:hypothetical protein ACJBSR_11320 [Streptococcus suis]
MITQTRLHLAQKELENFVNNMLELGFRPDELTSQLDDYLKGVTYE